MKVLICSYSPATFSSYGTIVADLWTRLAKTGEFDVIQHAWFHGPIASPVPWKLVLTNGEDGDKFGAQSFDQVVSSVKPDVVWVLGDIYMFRYMLSAKRRLGFRLVVWTLTEGEPVDEDNIPFLKGADEVVAITKWAASKWQARAGKQFRTIWHGVDTQVFSPVTEEQKTALRDKHSAGRIAKDDYLITFVGRNQARKRPWIPYIILHYLKTGAWGWDANRVPILARWDPDRRTHAQEQRIQTLASPIAEAKLWMHSHDEKREWSFERFEREWGLSGDVWYTEGLGPLTGLSKEMLADIYRASDVISMVSGSEGFGVPIIEAASCGVPSVYTDYSGCGEIGEECKGYPVPYDSWDNAKFTHVRWVNPNLAYAVEAFYRAWEDVRTRRTTDPMLFKNRLHEITKVKFDQDNIVAQWTQALREVVARPQITIMGERA